MREKHEMALIRAQPKESFKALLLTYLVALVADLRVWQYALIHLSHE
jgi:hypothetical protein